VRLTWLGWFNGARLKIQANAAQLWNWLPWLAKAFAAWSRKAIGPSVRKIWQNCEPHGLIVTMNLSGSLDS
jgi:hypothetical protein